MAVTLTTESRNLACDAVVNNVNGGKLKIKQGGSLLVTVPLEANAFEPAGTGAAGQARAIGDDGTTVVSAGNPLIATGTGAGSADAYDVTKADDTVCWSGVVTITGGGGDLTLDNVSIAVGQEVRITTWAHTQPA
jgi:hypothetical protein